MNKFLESLNKVKTGTATEEEAAYIHDEIAKYEAIETYLTQKLDESLTVDLSLDSSEEIENTDISEKKISKKIRNRILKTVIATLLIIALIAGAVVASCNVFYYNPNKGVEPVYGGDGQLFLDMWAFSELHSPEYYTSRADVWRDGPGSYRVRLYQYNLFSNKSESVSERIVRGRVLGNEDLTLNSYWRFPTSNAFGYREGTIGWVDEDGNEHRTPNAETLEWQLDALRQLPSSSLAAVYVTFHEDISLAEFVDFYNQYKDHLRFDYAAVTCDDEYIPSTIGFSPNHFGVRMENMPEGYPYFQMWGYDEDATDQETAWAQHFDSLVRYMLTRQEFLDTMASVNGIGSYYYRQTLDYIEKNGMNIYGVYVIGNIEQIVSFIEETEPFDFHINDVKLSVFSRS